MRELLLCLLLACASGRLLAQAPQTTYVVNAGVCVGSTGYVLAPARGGTATTIIWKESTDGQQSWHTVPDSPPYTMLTASSYG